jgi:hypothetical protein
VFPVRVANNGLMLEGSDKEEQENCKGRHGIRAAVIPPPRVFWLKSVEDDEKIGDNDLGGAKEFVRV